MLLLQDLAVVNTRRIHALLIIFLSDVLLFAILHDDDCARERDRVLRAGSTDDD